MEASKFLGESNPRTPNVVALVDHVDQGEPIYHFSVDGRPIIDVGATRENSDNGLITYNFFNDYKPFAAADLIEVNGAMCLEWFGQEGDHYPEEYLKLLPQLVEAAVYADYGVQPFGDGAYRLH